MTPDEADDFARHEFAQDAVELRRWDDLAKVVDLKTPPLEHFLKIAAECCRDKTEAAE